ncbi:glycosyl transferase [[Clostridium] sordellii]|uniref:glycosyltransferase n=1 Tax=Paraclostridium sordellii TaxID=1505 RepID=UPI0002E19D62|nr:glycosyltransferase [Paeniclostridium sordellii]TAN65382.1 glycosyltransferase [Paeniclostridium sordellii 8483]CEK31312.1 glycosyl transferase [[Clostridium] sordellii] [Paeniclostridium sordellii]
MNNIKVSIIVPVYNVKPYLNKCMDTLVNQTLNEIEIIVVNDGSTDGSIDIIKKYKEKYPNKIVVIDKGNEGVGEARNSGIKIAKGEYLGFVDSDDYIETNMFEVLYKNAKDKNSDIAICQFKNVDENYNLLDTENIYLKPNIKTSEDLDQLIKINPAPWNKIYKKELFIKNDVYFTKYWFEDLEAITKVLLSSERISFVDQKLYCYLYRRSTSSSNIIKKDKIYDIFNIFDSIILYLKNKNKYNLYKEVIEFYFIKHITSYLIQIKSLDNEDYNNVSNKVKNYLNTNFKDWKNNKYLSQLWIDKNKTGKIVTKIQLTFYKIGMISQFKTLFNMLKK